MRRNEWICGCSVSLRSSLLNACALTRAAAMLDAALTQTFESIDVLFPRLHCRQSTSAMENIVSKTHCARNQVEAQWVETNLALHMAVTMAHAHGTSSSKGSALLRGFMEVNAL